MRTKWIAMGIVTVLGALSGAGEVRAQGARGGNGGYVVNRTQGRYVVLDLLEAGLEDRPMTRYTDLPEKFQQRVNWITMDMNELTTEDRAALAQALWATGQANAHALLATIETYSWRWVSENLGDIGDVQTFLAIPRSDIFQAAIRKDFAILIQKEIWRSLDSKNRVALLLHEILYALIRPELVAHVEPQSQGIYKQDGGVVRQVVGDLFAGGAFLFQRYERGGQALFPGFPLDSTYGDYVGPSPTSTGNGVYTVSYDLHVEILYRLPNGRESSANWGAMSFEDSPWLEAETLEQLQARDPQEARHFPQLCELVTQRPTSYTVAPRAKEFRVKLGTYRGPLETMSYAQTSTGEPEWTVRTRERGTRRYTNARVCAKDLYSLFRSAALGLIGPQLP
jgi:hypothetical protein